MITKELAKQLKDAGFEQDSYRKIEGYVNGKHNYVIYKSWRPDKLTSEPRYRNGVNPEYVYIPTLEELIGACGVTTGYDDGSLYGFSLEYDDVARKWDAGYNIGTITMRGKTPSEAVAKLWLALNEK